jgi:hypothetical protein
VPHNLNRRTTRSSVPIQANMLPDFYAGVEGSLLRASRGGTSRPSVISGSLQVVDALSMAPSNFDASSNTRCPSKFRCPFKASLKGTSYPQQKNNPELYLRILLLRQKRRPSLSFSHLIPKGKQQTNFLSQNPEIAKSLFLESQRLFQPHGCPRKNREIDKSTNRKSQVGYYRASSVIKHPGATPWKPQKQGQTKGPPLEESQKRSYSFAINSHQPF